MTDQVNEAVAWMREGATTVMHNVRFDKPTSGPWIPLYTHPARGVVDEAMRRLLEPQNRKLWKADLIGEGISQERMREILQAAQPAVPSVPDAILRAFSDAAVDAAWTGTGIVRLIATDGEITAECVPPSSATFAATPKDQPAQGMDGE